MKRALQRVLYLAAAAFFGASAVLVPALCRASGSSTGNLNVTASINTVCTASSPTLDFGGYNPVTTNALTSLDSSTTITLNCSRDGSVTLGFDLGVNAAGSHCGASPQRCMANGSDYLNYNIYASTNDRTSGSAWTSPVSETISGGTAAVSIYGRVPAGQDVKVGSYSDTLVATVYY